MDQLFRARRLIRLTLIAVALQIFHLNGQPVTDQWPERVVREVQSSSFPELAHRDVAVARFRSVSDYFQARFSMWRFLIGAKKRYIVRVNSGPEILSAPEESRRAIVAHELAHVAYYAKGNRIRLLGMARFSSQGFREKFEKAADLEAIRRGYAQGLKQYRVWLYDHVPAAALPEKKRDYFTPVEIDLLERSISPGSSPVGR